MLRSLCAVALAGVVMLAAPRPAKACGGCFVPPGTTTVVTGHRMAMTVSTTQSVLWDQIQYSGEPEDFAWVLPVKPGARVEASTSAFFEVLDFVTAVRVQSPYVDCGGGDGCGHSSFAAPRADGLELASSEDSGGGGKSAQQQDPVEVLHQGTAGPYETVTLSTDQPGALNDWLDNHGYNVDDASQPIIDQYVEEGFDFIALRLQPGKGVRQMTPVRVISPGSNVTLPLRMVAVGTGPLTPIVLFVIGEGRYRASGFTEATINTNVLAWNFQTETSNYAGLWKKALEVDGGAAWFTAYAQKGTLTGAAGDTATGPMLFPARVARQARENDEVMGACNVAFQDPPFENQLVVNPCPPGEPWTSPACGAVAPGELDARKLGCDGVEDVAVALEGLHLLDATVTRLEANLPREVLAQDLVLEAAPEQGDVVPILQATIAIRPEYACDSGLPTSGAGRAPTGTALGLAMGTALLALFGRLARAPRARLGREAR